MSERRGLSRQKSLLGGFVQFDNSPSAIDCLIRDFSDRGARLKFTSLPMGADALSLHIPAKNQTLRARVEWRSSNEIGVSFVTDTSESQSHDSSLSERVERLEAEMAGLKQTIRRMQQDAAPKASVG